MMKSPSLAFAAFASLAPSAALALPQNCGELPDGPGSSIAYLKKGGGTPGAIELLVCSPAYECQPVRAIPASAQFAVSWQGGVLVLATDAKAEAIGSPETLGTTQLPEMRMVPWSARGAAKEATWISFDSARCSVPPPIG